MSKKVYIYNYDTGKKEAVKRLSKDYLNRMYARYRLARRKSIKQGYKLSEELTKNEYVVAYMSLIEDRRIARQKGRKVSMKDPALYIAERDEVGVLTRRQAYRIQKKLREAGERVSIRDIRQNKDTEIFWNAIRSEQKGLLASGKTPKQASKIISRRYFDS